MYVFTDFCKCDSPICRFTKSLSAALGWLWSFLGISVFIFNLLGRPESSVKGRPDKQRSAQCEKKKKSWTGYKNIQQDFAMIKIICITTSENVPSDVCPAKIPVSLCISTV